MSEGLRFKFSNNDIKDAIGILLSNARKDLSNASELLENAQASKHHMMIEIGSTRQRIHRLETMLFHVSDHYYLLSIQEMEYLGIVNAPEHCFHPGKIKEND